jgi:hypothetical protein
MAAVVEAVSAELTEDRIGMCDLSTRLLAAACGYALKHGTLTFQGAVVTDVYRVAGNVRRPVTGFTGGAVNRGHSWLRMKLQDGSFKHVDLTTRQFFAKLDKAFYGDPQLPPFFASLEGRLDSGGVALSHGCGIVDVNPEWFEDAAAVIETYAGGRPDWGQKLARVYAALDMA